MRETKVLNLKKVRADDRHTVRSLEQKKGVYLALMSYWDYGKRKIKSPHLLLRQDKPKPNNVELDNEGHTDELV
ncbi:hypothetical protein [Staphylococcus phage vB_SauH_DELF3]|nr:hypothetical protein [Staphylococcus phage vB_SauH_DELF3]